jgi:hypothetical protein
MMAKDKILTKKDDMIQLRESNCKGCKSYKYCSIPPVRYNIQCPCLKCLIKSMCNDSCREYIDYCNVNVD